MGDEAERAARLRETLSDAVNQEKFYLLGVATVDDALGYIDYNALKWGHETIDL